MFEADLRGWEKADAVDLPPHLSPLSVPSLAVDTLIATPKGAVSAGDLQIGDLVLTRDAGFRAIKWLGRRQLAGPAIHLRAGVLRNAAALTVSPEQALLVADPRAELMFDTAEVLVPAAYMVDGVGVVRGRAACNFVQIGLDGHHMIFAAGVSVETLCFDTEGLAALDRPARVEIFGQRPELNGATPNFDRPARRYLDRLEARVLMAEVRAATPGLAAE